MRSTVVIDGCHTRVDNVLDVDGCTIADRLDDCAATAKNHGHYVACVTKRAKSLKAHGLITGKDQGTLVSCAAKADMPEDRVSHKKDKKQKQHNAQKRHKHHHNGKHRR